MMMYKQIFRSSPLVSFLKNDHHRKLIKVGGGEFLNQMMMIHTNRSYHNNHTQYTQMFHGKSKIASLLSITNDFSTGRIGGLTRKKKESTSSSSSENEIDPDRNKVYQAELDDSKQQQSRWENPFSRFQQQGPNHHQQQQSKTQEQEDKENSSLSPETSKWLSRLGVIGTGLIILGGKTKYLLAALKLTKMSTLLSMFATIGAYSLLFGLPYAAGFVGLIFVHETGHVLAMRHYGITTSPIMFIPFMGAFVQMQNMPRNVGHEAVIAIAGPIFGSAASLAVGLVGLNMESQLLISLGHTGLLMNAFNLMPIGQLDGGRIADAISPHLLLGGLGLGGYLIATGTFQSPVFYLVMLAAGFQTYERYFGGIPLDPTYYSIGAGARMLIGAGYFSLIAAILASMAVLQRKQKSPKQLREEEARKTGKLIPETSFETFSKDWIGEDEDLDAKYINQMRPPPLAHNTQQQIDAYFRPPPHDHPNKDVRWT